MTVTEKDGMAWQETNSTDLDRDRLASDDHAVQMFNMMNPTLSKRLWDSGCWLASSLRDLGANDDDVRNAQFAHGQRSFGGNPWRIAADYINEFAESNDISDRPGAMLAEEITRNVFGGESSREENDVP